jgi:hypothetical protein
MFPMSPESFRAALHTQTSRMVDMNKKALDLQASTVKQTEKAMVNGLQSSLSFYENGLELQKAAMQSWLDMLAPKTEAKN